MTSGWKIIINFGKLFLKFLENNCLLMNIGLNYNVNLPEDVDSILNQELWVMDNVSSSMISTVSDPVKFSANTWIFVRRGFCRADISLISRDITGPALVMINNSQIMQPTYISPDFEGSVMVVSKRLQESIFVMMANSQLYTLFSRHNVVPLNAEIMPHVDNMLRKLKEILADADNPYRTKALLFEIMGFIYSDLYKFYNQFQSEILSNQGRMCDRFLALVQDNYKKERFLDFYASKLEITPKHLSRTIKNQTGYTAVEWIERFVILEAKVLLKSSNLNIQQIADELNFPSQSFFGKYFKKYAGMSPKEFRNS